MRRSGVGHDSRGKNKCKSDCIYSIWKIARRPVWPERMKRQAEMAESQVTRIRSHQASWVRELLLGRQILINVSHLSQSADGF